MFCSALRLSDISLRLQQPVPNEIKQGKQTGQGTGHDKTGQDRGNDTTGHDRTGDRTAQGTGHGTVDRTRP